MITHYTPYFDDAGKPIAIEPMGENDPRIGGVLPSGWDNTFWDWQPRNDLNGSWVQLVDLKRDALWKEAKDEKDNVLLNGYPTYEGILQVDKTSLESLRARTARLQMPNAPNYTLWTMMDNSVATFTAEQFISIQSNIEDWLESLHAWSQELRVMIYDSTYDTLEKLASIQIKGSYPAP